MLIRERKPKQQKTGNKFKMTITKIKNKMLLKYRLQS